MYVVLFLVVSTSAIDCLERLVSKMTYYVSSGTLNPTHTLTHLHFEAVFIFTYVLISESNVLYNVLVNTSDDGAEDSYAFACISFCFFFSSEKK